MGCWTMLADSNAVDERVELVVNEGFGRITVRVERQRAPDDEKPLWV